MSKQHGLDQALKALGQIPRPALSNFLFKQVRLRRTGTKGSNERRQPVDTYFPSGFQLRLHSRRRYQRASKTNPTFTASQTHERTVSKGTRSDVRTIAIETTVKTMQPIVVRCASALASSLNCSTLGRIAAGICQSPRQVFTNARAYSSIHSSRPLEALLPLPAAYRIALVAIETRQVNHSP
jgi:hypothetical protein